MSTVWAAAPDPDEITDLLRRALGGDADAESDLLRRAQPDLQRVAQALMRRERADHTLQPTALINEAFMRLLRNNRIQAGDRRHFYALAASTMRRILIDYARKKKARKNDGGLSREPLIEQHAAETPDYDTILLIAPALEELSAVNARQARMVDLRYFAGFTEEETAEILGVTPRTLRRDWIVARAWLHARIAPGSPPLP